MKLAAFIIAAALACSAAHAGDDVRDAIAAGVADCASTGAALALGGGLITEGNPLGAIAACGLKIPVIAYANSRPEPQRTQVLHFQHAAFSGAAVNNIAVLLGVAGPAAIAAGVITALVLWHRGGMEREFMAICAAHRAANPTLTCTYSQGST